MRSELRQLVRQRLTMSRLATPPPSQLRDHHERSGSVNEQSFDFHKFSGDQQSKRATITPGGGSRIDRWMRKRMRGFAITAIVVLTVLAGALVLPMFSASFIVSTLGGIAAVFATLALAGLVWMMLKDVMIPVRAFNRRKKPQPRLHPDARFWYAAGSGTTYRDSTLRTKQRR